MPFNSEYCPFYYYLLFLSLSIRNIISIIYFTVLPRKYSSVYLLGLTAPGSNNTYLTYDDRLDYDEDKYTDILDRGWNAICQL